MDKLEILIYSCGWSLQVISELQGPSPDEAYVWSERKGRGDQHCQ